MNKIAYITIALILIFSCKEMIKDQIKHDAINDSLGSIMSLSDFDEVANQNWFTNTQYGLSFESPKRMREALFYSKWNRRVCI